MSSPEWNESHEATFLLSNRHLRRLSDGMKLPNFLRLPKSHRRNRSKARSELDTGPAEGQDEAVPPRPTESTPDLRIGTSTLSTPSPLTLRNRETNGMQTILLFHDCQESLSHTRSHNTDPETTSDQILTVAARDQSSLQKSPVRTAVSISGAAPQRTSGLDSTAYAATKLAVDLVKESSDAFPPLKSVAGGLSAILNCCEVRCFFSELCRPRCLQSS